MAKESGRENGTSVSRIIRAPRRKLYEALLNPDALVAWLPPKGMTGHVFMFDAREGGGYRMSLTYAEPNHAARGKTSEHMDVVQARFVELRPDERIVQQVEFESGDPAFAGTMTITWTFAEGPGGTEVTVLCEDVPSGIQPNDHEVGLNSTLENLAAFTER